MPAPRKQKGKGTIKQHIEVICDPLRGTDADHPKDKVHNRQAAFRTLQALYSWIKIYCEEDFDKEITVTCVLGPMVLSAPMKRGFFKDTEPTDAINEIVAHLANMLKMILTGAAGPAPAEQSKLIKTATEGDVQKAAAVNKAIKGKFGGN